MIVVISQSAAQQPGVREYEEQLVTHLLLEAGCEVNLLPDLASLETESTGLLCLEGIRGSMVLLSWQTAAIAHSLLRDHGIHGQFMQHQGSSEASPLKPHDKLAPGVYDAMQRTIYHLQLDLDQADDYYTARIRDLEKESKIQTVSLGDAIPPSPPLAESGNSTVATNATNGDADESSVVSTRHVANPVPKRSVDHSVSEDSDSDLDALIDRLDDFPL